MIKKVSIIMPYGVDRPYFKKAFESAITQDFSREMYEIIIVNDGVRAFSKKDLDALIGAAPDAPSVKYYEVAFKNLSKVVNFGIEKSSGEYYTILPDDDIFLKNKIKVLYSALDSGPYHAAYSLPFRIDSEGKRVSSDPKVVSWGRAHPIVSWRHVVAGDGLMINGISTMYSREASDKAGGWDEKLTRAEEWEFHLRLLKCGYNFLFVDERTVEYRIHGENKSKKRGAAERKAQMKYIYSKLKINKKRES
jgi:glycosyltransferase involved in cell wall biosynthesis